jgi:hypothetical protein
MPRLDVDGSELNGVIRVDSNQQKWAKPSLAVIGASAVVAAVVGVAVANEQSGAGTVVSGPGMTLGATTTTTTPPTAPATSVAVPTAKATPPQGFR